MVLKAGRSGEIILRRRRRNKFRFIILFLILIAIAVSFLFYKYNSNPSDEDDSANQIEQEDLDITAPEIILGPLKDEFLKSIDDFVEPGYIAIDNRDGNLTDYVQTSITRIRPNYYRVKYTVEDSAGNTATKSHILHVVSGEIALTFDDGPSLNVTPEILDILKANNIHATFFVLGFNDEKAPLIKREYDEGHSIGYHGVSHKYSDIYASIDTLMENFYQIEQDVMNVTGGESSRIIRFPGGSSNTVSKNYCQGIMSEAATRVMSEGYVYFDWNVDSDDAGSAKTSEEIFTNVTSTLIPGRLNVVLMHDAASKSATLGALQDIIDFGVENDYQFVTLTVDSKQVKHGISN